MTPHARKRQQRYRERRKAEGFHRLEVWVPPDVLAEIGKRWKPYGDFSRPQLALIALARRALELPKPNRTA